MGPIAKSTIKTSFVLGLRLVVQAGTLLLVARMLGPEQFGAFAAIAALAVLMGTFSTFGTHLVLLGEVSKNKDCREQVLSYAIPTTLISGSCLFLAYLLICIVLFAKLNLPFSVFAFIGITETVLLPLFVLPATEQLAMENTARSQFFMLLPLAMRMLVAVGIYIVEPEYPLVLFSYFYVITALLALVFMKLYVKNAWLSFKQWKLASKDQLRYSSAYAFLAVTAVGPSELDKLLSVKLLSIESSGLYSAGSRIVSATTLPVLALLLSALPKLFRYTEYDPIKNKELKKWIVFSVFLYGLSVSLFLWVVSPIFEWFFGEKYNGLSEVIVWLCMAVPGLALRIVAGSLLITINRPWFRAVFEIFGMLILSISSVFLTILFNVKGMVLSVICAEWAMAILGFLLYFIARKKNA